jgi:hypothetical protein
MNVLDWRRSLVLNEGERDVLLALLRSVRDHRELPLTDKEPIYTALGKLAVSIHDLASVAGHFEKKRLGNGRPRSSRSGAKSRSKKGRETRHATLYEVLGRLGNAIAELGVNLQSACEKDGKSLEELPDDLFDRRVEALLRRAEFGFGDVVPGE